MESESLLVYGNGFIFTGFTAKKFSKSGNSGRISEFLSFFMVHAGSACEFGQYVAPNVREMGYLADQRGFSGFSDDYRTFIAYRSTRKCLKHKLWLQRVTPRTFELTCLLCESSYYVTRFNPAYEFLPTRVMPADSVMPSMLQWLFSTNRKWLFRG